MISETQLEILNSKETNYTNPVTSNVQNPSTYELASTKQVTSKSNEDSYLEVDFKESIKHLPKAKKKIHIPYLFQALL